MLNKKIISIILILTMIFSISANSLTAFAENAENQEKAEISDGIDGIPDDSNDKEEKTTSDVNMFGTPENEVALMNGTVPFAGGSGTEEDPYQVSTPEQLNEVRNNLDKYFIQINDIDMSEATSEGGIYWNDGKGWEPIGTNSDRFRGVYNGNKHCIEGLNINDFTDNTAGLFGYAAAGAILECITMTDGEYRLEPTSETGNNIFYIGCIVAYTGENKSKTTEVSNCVNVNKITITGESKTKNTVYIGGIGGKFMNTHTYMCLNMGEIYIDNAGNTIGVGGVIGGFQTETIEKCSNAGNIECVGYNNLDMSGICNELIQANIKQCCNTGNIIVYDDVSKNPWVAGITSDMRLATITDCINIGNIIPKNNSAFLSPRIGGICSVIDTNVTNCLNIGNTYGADALGHIVQGIYTGKYQNHCYSIDSSPIDLSRKSVINSKNLSETELKKKESFEGFDFDTVWDISSDTNNGYPYLRNMPSLPHTHIWGEWKITQEPTQTETGTAERICSNDSSHKDTATLPVLTDATVWTKGAYAAPTCENTGSQEYTSEYGTVTETFEAIGHDWNDWVTVKEATVAETGMAERVCKNDSSHKETKELPKIQNEAGFAGGSGTEEDPYQVAAPEQLNNVRNYLSSYFIQICDIDMTDATSDGGTYWNDGAGWKPIGDNSKKFTGNYNGAEYSIIGLYCNAAYAGLFGYNNGGTIKNVNLTGTIEGGKNAFSGGVVAYNFKGTVINCINNADITSSGTYAGGVIGYNTSSSDITDCYNYGNVVSSDFAGGIVGSSQNAKISYCGNNGNITSTTKTDTQVGYGGIAGKADKDITQCYNIGDVTSTVTNSTSSSTCCAIGVGGIVGLYNGSTISDCFNTGKISSLYTCGDIVGSGAALSGWTRITTGETYYTTPESSVLTIRNCYNSCSNSTNNFYGYNASGYSFNYGYQANAGSYSNIITVSASNSYNINSDADTNIIQLTESEMKQQVKYIGFDFDTIWTIKSSQNNGMPYLQNVGNFIPTYSAGDINGDGYVDFIDAQLILKYDAGLLILTDEQISRSDLNGDGYIDFIDAQIILKYDAGLIDTL